MKNTQFIVCELHINFTVCELYIKVTRIYYSFLYSLLVSEFWSPLFYLEMNILNSI